MSRLQPELYAGREQTYVKHLVLESYLEKLAYKIGMGWRSATLNHVDGFAGPWKHQGDRHEDTSPHIALRVLRGVQPGLVSRGRPELRVRAMFVEEDEARYRNLLESFANDPAVVVRHGQFESLIPEAVSFGSTGPSPFCFTFIDPCGWTGYGLDAITPLLRVEPGEVLINFMTSFITKHMGDQRAQIGRTFADLFGTASFREVFSGLDGQDRQDAMVAAYCDRVRARGAFKHVVHAVILNPLADRTHYHLVYATRHDEGLKTFRDVERAALQEQMSTRAGARQRRSVKRTGQPGLFGSETFGTPYLDELRQRYHAKARAVLTQMLLDRGTATFDELAIAAMHQPMTAEQGVRDFLVEEEQRGRVAFDGLADGERKPKWNQSHTVRWLHSPDTGTC